MTTAAAVDRLADRVRLEVDSGRSLAAQFADHGWRVIAVSMMWKGLRVETPQSLDSAQLAPASIRERKGYIHLAISGPQMGTATSVTDGSLRAHRGWMLGMTPRAAKRGMSSGRTTWTWAS